jgi:hypothetical protein
MPIRGPVARRLTYSVPWRLIGKGMRAILAGSKLRVCHGGREVTLRSIRAVPAGSNAASIPCTSPASSVSNPGERHCPHCPGSIGSHPAWDDGPLPSGGRPDRRHAEPARPTRTRGDRARINRHCAARARSGGHLPPPWRRLSRRSGRQPNLRTSADHGGSRDVPDGGARRPCRAMRGAR